MDYSSSDQRFYDNMEPDEDPRNDYSEMVYDVLCGELSDEIMERFSGAIDDTIESGIGEYSPRECAETIIGQIR